MEAMPNWIRRSINIKGRVLIRIDYVENLNIKHGEVVSIEKFLDGVMDDLRREAGEAAAETRDEGRRAKVANAG